ncbi:hypothetical protein L6452_26764 [Arctium lappa]|uniref:Uncharacterized protein n=1 Tax=Arctium lappa TaxID=4217 RepID=A0ACB8ZW28_ARCLA|nr:hypothetical protein L6452_26764 [Arctium lappa]
MLCLMETRNMRGIVDDAIHSPNLSTEIMKQYESLLKGWIFGSVNEGVLGTIVGLDSANDVWDKLKRSFCDSTMYSQRDSAETKPEANKETEDKDISTDTDRETEIEKKDAVSVEMEREGEYKLTVVSAEVETMTEEEKKEMIELKKKLRMAVMKSSWWHVQYILMEGRKDAMKDALRDKINDDGNTLLHLAVGLSVDDLVLKLLESVDQSDQERGVLKIKNAGGSTALHVAAIVDNVYAAELLVKKDNQLLPMRDHAGYTPLDIAYHNMHFATFMYLLKAEKTNSIEPDDRTIKIVVDVLVNAISAKEYNTALTLIEDDTSPKLLGKNDEVLMALARTFPSGLNHWETLVYPSLGDIRERFKKRTTGLMLSFKLFRIWILSGCDDWFSLLFKILILPLGMLSIVYALIRYLILMVHFLFFIVYYFLWKMATKLVTPIKHVEKTQKDWEDAKKVLEVVCGKIDEIPHSHGIYKRPILEAACRNAYEVVDEILVRSPKAIQSIDESGYDIIQLAVMHRSEKVYNLIHQIPTLKSRYRTVRDSSGNNMLHLAGKFAPLYELKRRTGAALQLQWELQWHKELKKLVFPAFITQENIFKETPEMVFTREHENLVKEGEKWMKTAAESCSITAALITTIVFAAAITVPGGSDQETGTPLFTNDIAFIVFATSDAISLFTSTTSLLVFLSILTARFAEQDFLVRLPRRLIIGLCSLFLSTTAMIVAFSATLFLVFSDRKLWMLAPICGLACFPILLFLTLQLPLMVDLLRSTYVPIFGNSIQCRFNPDVVQLYCVNEHFGDKGNKGTK